MENKNIKIKCLIYVVVIGTAIIIIPMIVINFLMDFGWFKSVGHGSDDGWLGFWGGYLGAIVSIGGLYWQTTLQIRTEKNKIKKEIEHQNANIELQERHRKEDISREKEKYYMESRPFFSVAIREIKPDGKTYITNLLNQKDCFARLNKPTTFGVVVHNFSEKPMMAVEVEMYPFDTKVFSKEVVKVNRIDKNSSAQMASYALSCLYTHIPYKETPKMKGLNEALPFSLRISFCTEKHEKVRKIYEIDPNYNKDIPNILEKMNENMRICYFQKENTITENQNPKAFNKNDNYSVDSFIESLRFQ